MAVSLTHPSTLKVATLFLSHPRPSPPRRFPYLRCCTSNCSSMASDNSLVRVAAAQMTSTDDLSHNFSTCAGLVKEAVAAGANLLCLPENFSFMGRERGQSVAIAEALDGPIMRRYCSPASHFVGTTKFGCHSGGFQERGPDDVHLYNTHVIVDDAGNIRSSYRKIHLFDVDVPGGMVYKDSSFIITGGEEINVTDSPFGRLGVTVCYDLRFPELYQKLRFEHHARIMLVPAAFTRITGEAHWEILLRARAIETQCYFIAAAQTGWHNEKRESYGDTIIVDPWGKVISRLEDRQATGVAVADIDFSLIESVRNKMPVSQHRKPPGYWKVGTF